MHALLRFVLFVGTLGIALPAAAQEGVGRSQEVARVGRFTISAGELLDSYEFGPAFVKRNDHPLRKHLGYMIDEKLLALAAEREGLDTTSFVRSRLDAILEDLAVDRLYTAEVTSRVHLSKGEIDTASEKARVQIGLRWLFATGRNDIERHALRLKQGVSFDSLMSAPNGEGGSADARTLETTLLRLETRSPSFARAIGRLRAGECTPPLQGPDGFYIVRLDRITRNPVQTETEQARTRQDATALLTEARTQSIAADYAGSFMKTANPVIKAGGLNVLRAYLADRGLSRDLRVKWKIPSTFMTEAGPRPINDAGEFLKTPLVMFAGRTLTVRDYLEWFEIRQFQLKRTSLAAFNASVKQTIWRLVRDRLLIEEAFRRGLNHRNDVREESDRWHAKLLYLAWRRQLARQLTIGAQFDDQKEQVEIFRTLQKLRSEFGPTVNDSAVRALSRETVREPGSIDVVVYKPGGTFPRVAFPTIDERWQSFP